MLGWLGVGALEKELVLLLLSFIRRLATNLNVRYRQLPSWSVEQKIGSAKQKNKLKISK